MAKLKLRLGSEKIPVAGGRIVGSCGADGLQDLLQSLLRLSHSDEDVAALALRRKEARVELETAVQPAQARLVMAAVLLQQRHAVERRNPIRRFVQYLVQDPFGVVEIGGDIDVDK